MKYLYMKKLISDSTYFVAKNNSNAYLQKEILNALHQSEVRGPVALCRCVMLACYRDAASILQIEI
jgi:hypothetical protein